MPVLAVPEERLANDLPVNLAFGADDTGDDLETIGTFNRFCAAPVDDHRNQS